MSVLLIVGGAAALLFLMGKSKDGKSLPPGITTDQCIDENMPANMRDAVLDVLANTKDATTLSQMAIAAAQNGFTKAATCLQLLADEYGAAPPGIAPPPVGGTPPPPPGGMPPGQPPIDGGEGGLPGWLTIPPGIIPGAIPGTPPGQGATDKPHTIRYGDIPYQMANYYTGQGARFRELEPGNPHLGKLTTSVVNGQNVSNYPGWVPGAVVMLPLSWHPWDKPTPAPLGGTAPSTPVVPPVPNIADLLSTYNPWASKPGETIV